MRYSLLLGALKKHGVAEVGRHTKDGDTIAYLGRPKEAIVPFPFTNFPIYLEEKDPEIDEEIIEVILRRFEIKDLDDPMLKN